MKRFWIRELLLLVSLLFILNFMLQSNFAKFNNFRKPKLTSAKGLISYEEANEKIFKKFGYEIIEETYPIPKLREIEEKSCEIVNEQWLNIAIQDRNMSEPPRTIPNSQEDLYSLNGYMHMQFSYMNDRKIGANHPVYWNDISHRMKSPPTDNYSPDGKSVNHAMKAVGVNNQNGLVVGSLSAWVEVYALKNGAAHLLTVEYTTIIVEEAWKHRIETILPIDFVKKSANFSNSFDFVSTFSSIEHSGLGRFGDPMDAIGDFREMQKIRCALKKGGHLFLGIPIGVDGIMFNLHRIYGQLRLAMMFSGFEWIATYSGTSEKPVDLTETVTKFKPMEHIQYTLVLKKL
ncbi:unnamed protein product [Caenorhabditis angaria]|uniref:Uncharacterized protein n=1 Tax=Caenorhabditis angaria TaxID=860376 RepID=A0A9P1IME1_9PELO|nr:unnamed protein product [Caenorhabditis angaria]